MVMMNKLVVSKHYGVLVALWIVLWDFEIPWKSRCSVGVCPVIDKRRNSSL